jgi:hypothetical protein
MKHHGVENDGWWFGSQWRALWIDRECHSLEIGFSRPSSEGGGTLTFVMEHLGRWPTPVLFWLPRPAITIFKLSTMLLGCDSAPENWLGMPLKRCLFFSHGNALPGWTLLLTLIQSILLCPLRFTSSALLMTKILNVRSTRKQNVSLRNLLSLRPIAVYANLLATTVNASDLSTSPPLIPYSIMAALFGYLPSKPNLVKSH